jgi:preprotein translocase subunit SecA
MFSDLMGRIKLEIASSLFRTSASINAFESFLRNLPQKLIHETPVSTMSQPDPGQSQPPPEGRSAPAQQPEANGHAEEKPAERTLPIRHTGPQLARNDPCPQGTGRKFKNCCGADGKTKVCTGAGAQK